MAGIDIAGAASSTTVCVGLGVCVTAPVPSLIIAAVAKGIIQVADLAITVAEPIAYNTFKHTQIGVTYSSGSGDYAEWLRKANPLESFYPGAIVGVRAGQISMNTEGAEKVMVISTKPIVLGNMPEAGNENLYEKVAFMGQVPVKVLGKVNAGDCILPSGYANGIGIAVSPDKLKAEDYSRIVGMAWSDADGDQLNVINVAVGLNNNDAARLVGKQENKIAELETQIQGLQSQINTTNQMLAKLVPGFDLGGGQTNNTPVQMKKQPAAQSGDYSVGDPQERTIVYFKVTKEQIQEGYTLAESMMKEKGIDLDTHPFFKKVRSEPGFKTSFIDEMQESVNKAIDNRSKLDARSGSSVKVY
jgi:hypothetical protein